MENIKTEENLTTKILISYIESGLNNTQILSELNSRCEFDINREEICVALGFLRGTFRIKN